MNVSHISPHVQPISEPLHVITAVFNPDRSRTRYAHFRTFKDHMQASGVILHTVELAFGDREFEVTSASDPLDMQYRTKSEMWYKENLQNAAVRRLPATCKYLAFIDFDFHMTRPDWAYETLHLLQRYPVVQLFSSYSLLDTNFRHDSPITPSYMAAWRQGKRPVSDTDGWIGATGGAWAYTREAFDTLGGLLDSEVVGSADWHMVFGLLGLTDPYIVKQMVSPGYCKALARWSANAARLHQRVGCLDNHALHYYHGPLSARGYSTRWQILTKYAFDPDTDLVRDSQGLWQFAGNKPDMENEIVAYFEGRSEDSAPVSPAPVPAARTAEFRAPDPPVAPKPPAPPPPKPDPSGPEPPRLPGPPSHRPEPHPPHPRPPHRPDPRRPER